MAKKRPKIDYDNALRGVQNILTTPSQTTGTTRLKLNKFFKATGFTSTEVTKERQKRYKAESASIKRRQKKK